MSLTKSEREEREHLYGCVVDLAPEEEPDGCVLDYGVPSDCMYAKNRRTKWTCQYWQLKSKFARARTATPEKEESRHDR